MAQGLWNIGGINLPDFGISEALGGLGGLVPNNSALAYSGPQNPLQTDTTKSINGRQVPIGLKTSSTGPGFSRADSNVGNNVTSGKPTGGGDSELTLLQKVKNSGGLNPDQANRLNQLLSVQQQPQADPFAGLRNEISTAWDQYIGGLNDTGNTFLPQQRTAQENIVNSQYDQGVNTLNTEKSKSLRDIGSNIKNAFQAGNVFLGSRGAGDSSAANQYSFAINQEANKQTGQLNEFVNTQLSNLKSTRDQQIQGIAQWFAEQQQAIKQAISTGQLQKSQDIQNLSRQILDQALAATNATKQNAMNQYNALLGWAASNSTNMGQLQQNIAGIPQALGQAQVDSTGNFRIPTGAGAFGNTQKTDIFGNPI